MAEATPTPYPLYSPESLVRDNPDVVLTGAEGAVTMRKTPAGLVRLRLRAVRAGRCFGVPAGWTNRPGPRLRLGLDGSGSRRCIRRRLEIRMECPRPHWVHRVRFFDA